MSLKFNPPPNWPSPPAGFVPPAGWHPDPAWGPAPPGWPLWIDQRSWLRRNAVAVTLVTVFLILPVSVELGQNLTSRSSSADRSAIEDALGAEGSLSDHDVDVVARLGTYPRAWNEAAAPLVRDYQDPSVSADRWVSDAGEHIDDMRAAVIGLRAQVLSISDPGLRRALAPMVQSYDRKLNAVVALRLAVARGDAAAEQEAISELDAAAEEGTELAASFLDRLRPFIPPADLERRLRERGEEVGDLFR